MYIVCCSDVLSNKNVLLVRGLNVLLNFFFQKVTSFWEGLWSWYFRVHREIGAMKRTCSFQSIWMVHYLTTLISCCPKRNSIQQLTFCKYSIRSAIDEIRSLYSNFLMLPLLLLTLLTCNYNHNWSRVETNVQYEISYHVSPS